MKIVKVEAEGAKAPPLPTFRFIPEDSSPNRLLEIWTPREALERVTRDHRVISDWIRAQPWNHARPTKDQWRYVGASKRLKACRNLLRDFVEELDELTSVHDESATNHGKVLSAADDMVRMPRELTEQELAEEAQREADILGAIRESF